MIQTKLPVDKASNEEILKEYKKRNKVSFCLYFGRLFVKEEIFPRIADNFCEVLIGAKALLWLFYDIGALVFSPIFIFVKLIHRDLSKIMEGE